MSEELKLKILALGLLSASAIGGEACKDCPHNIPRMSAALLTGDGEALRDCAKLLYKDCELVPGGTKARIAELEAERNRLREALNEFLDLESPYSLLQVMETLSDAAELLLNQYGYDGPEYELIQHAIDHGKGIREKATVQRKLMGQTICQN